MKTLSLKTIGCAIALALLTAARAQTPEESQPAPPPDAPPPPEVFVAPAQNGSTPTVIAGPGPMDSEDSNADAAAPQPAGPANVQTAPAANSTPYRGRGGDRNRGRWPDRESNQDQSASTGGDASAYVPPANAGTNGTDGIYLNFHGAPIDEVLNYLSDAAGFIIELDTHVSGTVDVWSAHPVSKDEAVQLLNSVLDKNGYAAIRSGRTLRIMSHEDAVHSQIPVNVGNDPSTIPNTDEIVTQIIPIRYVQARQLITDLSPLISAHATIMANDAGNSIVVTDTQANIHHLVEIVKAIDSSAEDVTEVQVFHLQFHDPVEVANLLTSIFADQSQNNSQAAPIRFGGFPGFGGGGFRRFFGGGGPGGAAGGNQGGGSSTTDRIRQHSHVVAVADQRTQSVLVTASKDLMPEIQQLVTQIDQESPKVAHVSVIHLENADPQQVQKVLQDFQANNGRNSSVNSQNSILMQRENQNTSSSSSGFGSSGFGNSGFGGGSGFGSSGFGGGGFGGGFRGGQ